jgi:ATP-binding cassette subfamily B protein
LALTTDIRTLIGSLSNERRRDLLKLSLLMPAVAFAEAAVVAAIFPFILMLAGQPQAGPALPFLTSILDGIGRALAISALPAAAALFAASLLLATALRLALCWISQQFAFEAGHELAVEIQHRLLHQPYSFHLHRHSSEMLASLDKIDHLIFNFALQAIQAVASIFVGIALVGILISVDPMASGLALLLFGGLFAIAVVAARTGFGRHATAIATAYDQRIRIVQEGVGAIRDIILDQSQDEQVGRFRAVDEQFMKSRAWTGFLMAAPRHLVEAIGLLLIAALAILISARSGGFAAALPLLGALALGGYRMLPLLGQLYGAWANIASSRPIISDVTALLNLPVPESQDAEPIGVRGEIRFDAVSYLYPDRTHHALHEINLVMRKGSRTAITGPSGSGKSTLADLLMGMVNPTEGHILVDGVQLQPGNLAAWRRSIAHVPQSMFLADASIAANIALVFNESALDMGRVRRAARRAQLGMFIEALPEGYDTKVGENAVRLSGGQRQRLALARALYKEAPILVLDEATSALDEGTEAAVMAALDELQAKGCTIFIIAHRASTVARCDSVVVLENGTLRSSAVEQPGSRPHLEKVKR